MYVCSAGTETNAMTCEPQTFCYKSTGLYKFNGFSSWFCWDGLSHDIVGLFFKMWLYLTWTYYRFQCHYENICSILEIIVKRQWNLHKHMEQLSRKSVMELNIVHTDQDWGDISSFYFYRLKHFDFCVASNYSKDEFSLFQLVGCLKCICNSVCSISVQVFCINGNFFTDIYGQVRDADRWWKPAWCNSIMKFAFRSMQK